MNKCTKHRRTTWVDTVGLNKGVRQCVTLSYQLQTSLLGYQKMRSSEHLRSPNCQRTGRCSWRPAPLVCRCIIWRPPEQCIDPLQFIYNSAFSGIYLLQAYLYCRHIFTSLPDISIVTQIKLSVTKTLLHTIKKYLNWTKWKRASGRNRQLA